MRDMIATVLRTILLSVCVLSAACGQDARNAPERQQGVERSEISTPEPSRMTTAESTAVAEDMGILARGKPPPEYQVRGEGTLIIGGDVLVRCAEVGAWSGPPSASRSVERQLREEQREQSRVCTEAGFPPDRAPR